MKIDSYSVQAQAQSVYYKSETVTAQIGVLTPLPAAEEAAAANEDADSVEIGKSIKDELAQSQKKAADTLRAAANKIQHVNPFKLPQNSTDLKMSALMRMLEILTGKKFKFQEANPELRQGSNMPQLKATISFQPASQMGFRVTSQVYEYEAVSYSASGVVKTADGREINFDMEMNMSREFVEYMDVTAQFSTNLHNVCDPLVINYGGTAASLTDTKFSFDLDVDGNMDSISFAGAGSGFLALDKNGDGKINDGSELFGPQSGNGFNDLRAYDDDGNGWIDENDEIFSQLKVWVKDEHGNDKLFSLLEVDVGAIFLGELGTQFTLNGGTAGSGDTNGYVRSTSFFLKESTGQAGTVQHVDLVT